jgi:peptidoglycan/xylan/chitin deacetylase (PgdA/CDA1 family)
MKITWGIVILTIACAMLSINTRAKDNAVILVYHHVSQSTPKATSVSPETFRQHMQYLADNHQVLPLEDVIKALQKEQPLPNKAVVITFDDGFKNIYENAHPILKSFDFPYTIFVNPPLIGKANYQLDWQQVKLMSAQNVSFANHGNLHQHLLTKAAQESEQDWLKRTMQNIEDAELMLEQNIGYSLKYFAYPYGEFDSKLKTKLRAKGYIGFAQHSGAVASYSDFSALPRFPAAGIYSNIDTLKVKLNSLAMPVDNVFPHDPKIELPSQKQIFKFNLTTTTDINPLQINCFQSGQIMPKKVSGKMLSIDIKQITQAGRHRVNCTAPSKAESGRYYWLSQPFFVPTNDGKWLD